MKQQLAPRDEMQWLWPTRLWNGSLPLIPQDNFTPERVSQLLSPGFDALLPSHARRPQQVSAEQLSLDSQTHIPIRASRADLCAWLWISQDGEKDTDESGSIHLHDPRAGAHLTVLPGLPWGRPAVLAPAPGTAVLWPGWLSWTLLPLSGSHRVQAVYCEIQTSDSLVRPLAPA
ncbi:hypothetical protein ACGFZU_37990 [Streptomyces tendae]|uniref:hypothetical protein n=1 Tax=Streptomyces tendae TaxID=1932 RepID=UPI00370FF393